MISVVMATYNGEKFIEMQLDSIKNQKRKANEVIIRDDGSTDKTVEIVKKYIESNNLTNWDFAVNENNKGFKKNFYDLLKLANGDIIFLSDQDDVWMDNKLAIMSEIMEKNAEIKALNSGIQLINRDLEPIDLRPRKNFYNANLLYSENGISRLNYLSLDDMIKRNISPGCSMAITHEIKEKFLRTYDFILAHDWYMNLLASIDNNCCFLNEKLTNYRIHEDNTLGLSTRWDIRSKLKSLKADQEVKLQEFEKMLKVITNLDNNYNLDKTIIKRLYNYLNLRVEFTLYPRISVLLKLRKLVDYRKSTTFRGRVMDILLSLYLGKLIMNN